MAIGTRQIALYVLALSMAVVGCGGYLHTHSDTRLSLAPCTDCPRVSGTISSPEMGLSHLTETLYTTKDVVVRTEDGVEIDAPHLELDTSTGEFKLQSMRGRISQHHVLIELPRGTPLNVTSKGHAQGDEHGYVMTGGASLSLGDDTIRAPVIQIRFL